MPQTTHNSFTEKLTGAIERNNSLLCLGLDPDPHKFPGFFPATVEAGALLAWGRTLIEQTADLVCCYKPNFAFYEQYGPAGLEALRQTIAAVPGDIPVLLDAKRGDIDSTAEAYARAAFHTLGAHALTVSPYLGQDALQPFIRQPERGIFLLCKTSNPGAADLQDLPQADGRPLYAHVAQLAQASNTRNNVGLVVGATHPQALARVRAAAPDLWFLVPGVGAQGGQLETALQAGLRTDGRGLLITVSRSLARASNPAKAAAELRDEIEQARYARTAPPAAARPSPETARVDALAADLLAAGCVRFGEFTLKSGLVSPIYLDLRQLISHPAILRRTAQAYAALARSAGLAFDRLAGIPYAGLPIATALALELDRPLLYPRREAKDYGTRAAIEGAFAAGETALVVDDLATNGGAKIEAIQKLEAAGLAVRDVMVLIDREQGAGPALAEAGYRLHAVCTLRQLLEAWRRSAAITPTQFETVSQFLDNPQTAQ